MSLTVVVTRDVQNRYRGFLGSVMLEVSAGVYIFARVLSYWPTVRRDPQAIGR